MGRKWGTGLAYGTGYRPDERLGLGMAPDPAERAMVEANIEGFRSDRLKARGAGRAEVEAEQARLANAAAAEADRAALKREKADRVAKLAGQLDAARAAKRIRESRDDDNMLGGPTYVEQCCKEMIMQPESVDAATITAAPANGSCPTCAKPFGKTRRCWACKPNRPPTRKFPRVAGPEPVAPVVRPIVKPAAEPEPVSVSPTPEVGPVPAVDVSLDAAAWAVARALVDALGREKVSAVLWAVADRLGLEA